MIKKLFLRVRTYYNRKNNKAKRESLSYEESSTVGILISNENPKGNELISQFVKSLIKEGKKVVIICNSMTNNCAFDFPFTRISFSEIKWNGTYRDEKINNFIKTEFDYLYSINISPFLPFENILSASKAKCRFGIFSENNKNILEVMAELKKGEGIEALIRLMEVCTKKFRS
ncbi:DUF6913 domain-containing protein [Sporocytophaga myxococcoides]|uniref:DUF6913 domain-containing protein n=1 Tax=Sporocytophaga myxococcoides TaxID=153721 RepID=UPI00041E6ECE|nr:hypothetical protein [Sporocytophaga myxococcoides]